VVATAGDLVFQGTYAGEFAAYAADTGKKLWSFDAQAPIIAAPSTFEVGGEQYVAVLVGGGGAYALSPGIVSLKSGKPRPLTRLLVFKLGGQAKLPAIPAAYKAPLNPPPLNATPAELQQGFELYSHFCGLCHGDTGVSGGVTPDLRYSPLLASDSFFDVVLGGALKDRGMISFAPVLTRPQVAATRSYLIKRAHETQEAQAKGQDLSAG
jgi:mono/diheme cytochrome c family protein